MQARDMNAERIAAQIDKEIESLKAMVSSEKQHPAAALIGWDCGRLAIAAGILREVSNRKSRYAPDMRPALMPAAAPKASRITVVITNFKRHDKVREAFNSCLAAGVQHIVISASGCDAQLAAVHDEFRAKHPAVVIDSIQGDRGCNEMWLRGVRLATTEWVHILHDDDKVLPSFMQLEAHLDNGAGFYHWDGAKHSFPPVASDAKAPACRALGVTKPGVMSTDVLWPRLLAENSLSISPVGGLFKRDHLVSVLEECEAEFGGEAYHMSPAMMVGNDLLIWLRAAERYPTFEYLAKSLVSYGHWQGSCTCADNSQGLVKLRKLYAATRSYYLSGPDIKKSDPVMARTFSFFDPPAEHVERYSRPYPLWLKQYKTNKWVHLPVANNLLPRFFADDRGRDVPYIKDLVDYAFKTTQCRVCVLTNMDTIPAPSVTRHLCQALRAHDAVYCYRRDVPDRPQFKELTDAEIRTETTCYSGLDLFAITDTWWAANKDAYPDLLYATEAWDYILKLLMQETGGVGYLYLIYHVAHMCEGVYNKGGTSQNQNRERCEPFLKARGIVPYWVSGVTPNPR